MFIYLLFHVLTTDLFTVGSFVFCKFYRQTSSILKRISSNHIFYISLGYFRSSIKSKYIPCFILYILLSFFWAKHLFALLLSSMFTIHISDEDLHWLSMGIATLTAPNMVKYGPYIARILHRLIQDRKTTFSGTLSDVKSH